ncbi:hypothetical protein GH714_039755 [Hevea brasiliensis]|uniref:Glycosyltransferase n=1 Tax=Hevea brasiliensis TaxID=3981 RepID=A0A6A6M4N4_HEVBR|nr:hypothetical protein GH714_039755 [Hevea brasiliensis]
MGNMKLVKGSKIILVPYPAQGHVNPMVKLALALLKLGFEPVMITPEFIYHSITSSMDPKGKIMCMAITDGLKKDNVPPDFFAIEKAMETNMPNHLETLVHKIDGEDGAVACIIVDLLASSAIEVARRCRIPSPDFGLHDYHIPDDRRHTRHGSPQRPGPICFLPNQPLLSTDDLPWLIGTPAARKARFKFWTRTLNRSRNLRWILMNSFSEENLYDQLSITGNKPLVFLVGALSRHAIIKNPSIWKEDMSSLQWLDKQKPKSVVYISFGSWVRPIGEAKVRCLALSLEAMGQPFIWVLGPAWREGLPGGYLERVSKKGKVVSWAPQMEVLQHQAVGCYLTHCGWNSTMEAIQCQKRLLCHPVAGDQFVNCAYIVEKWKIGVKINGFAQKDVEEGLQKVMDDNEMNRRCVSMIWDGMEVNGEVMECKIAV